MRRQVFVLSGLFCFAALAVGCASENRASVEPARTPVRQGPPRFYSGDSLGIKILKTDPRIVRGAAPSRDATVGVSTQ